MSSKQTKGTPEIERQIAAATGRALNMISTGRVEEYKAERAKIQDLRKS